MGAEQQQRHASYISSALIVLMLISSLTPFVIQMTNQSDNLNEIESIAYSTSFSNGSGEQLAGETLIMNSTDWLVESVRGMDVWDETNISQSGFDHVDLTRDDRGRARACLHETTGGLWLAKLEFGGATSIESVESGTQLLGEHCSIAVDEREKLHISYTDESGFLSSAYQRVSGVWNIRTIENQTQVSALKLLLNSKGEQNIVWLDDSNSLHLSTYTTWWTHEEILPGARIGTDFDAYMGDDDSINIFYQNLDTYQIIQGIRSPNGNWSLSALTAGSELGPAVAFGEDPSTGNVQFAYASSSQAGLTIVRDLSGQENGRLSPIVETVSTGSVSDEYATKALNDMDFDCDGLDDLLVSRPAANSETGAIDIFWGSGMGISPTPDYNLSGSIGGDRFGSSFANAGDVNGDGCEDLLVGATGAVDNLGYSTGVSYLYFGGNRTYSSANWSVKGEGQNDKFGGTVSSAGDVNNDGYSDILVAATGFTQSGGEGKVYLYRGSASGPSTSKDWSTRGYWQDVVQGWSMAAIGDINGDSYDDIALGAAGSFSEITGNGRVEVYVGSQSGSMSIDNYWTTTTTNTLLGYAVSGLGDLNGDGFDDFAFTEPLFDNSALGKVTVLRGSSNGAPDNPALELVGTQSSQLFGSDISLIGDLNDDGLEEIAISSIGLGTSPGKVEYFFADSTLLLRRGANSLLIEGVSGQHLGRTVMGGGDTDGDGQFEILVTSLDSDMGGNPAGAVIQIEKRNSEATEVVMQVDSIDLDLDDSGRFHLLIGSNGESIHLERPNAITNVAENWELKTISDSNVGMVVTRSGKTIILDSTGIFYEQSAHTLMSTNHPLASHDRINLDLVIDGEQSHIYTTSYRDATSFDVEVRTEEDSGFVTNTVTVNRSLGAAISGTFALTHNSSGMSDGWAIGNSLNGTEEFGDSAGCAMAEGTAAVAYTDVAANSTKVQLVNASGNSTTIQIWNQQSINDVICESDGNLLVAMYSNLLNEVSITRLNGSNVSSVDSYQPQAGMNVTGIHLVGGGQSVTTMLTVDSQLGDAYLCESNTGCSIISVGYENSDYFSSIMGGDGVHWIVHDGNSSVRRMVVSIYHNGFVEDVFTASTNGDICGVDMEVDAAGVVRIAACHMDVNSNNKLTSYRIYQDWDRDFVPIPWDEVPNVGGQWNDGDSDGYGDNADGPVPDECTNSGTGPFDRGSRWGLFGCSDADWDGWADQVDDCLNDQGNSWIDTQGCEDPDGDGWSSPGLHTTMGDQDPINWYQQRDSDEDGHLDNHGPDCCGIGGSSDIYPENGNQWEDLDNDGWGDNHDFEYANTSLRTANGVDVDADGSPDWFKIDWTGDQCPGEQGFSAFDRGGCADTDGDGWSDPHVAENAQETDWLYNRSQCHSALSDGHQGCADNWPGGGNSGATCEGLENCSMQWHDLDGDGYGDNSSVGAWKQDAFTEDPSQWNDTDGDGYGDNPSGTTPDLCTVNWGNSTVDRLGCPDSDGDGWSDAGLGEQAHPIGNADSNASNPNQWRDSDGDGFGDFTSQTNGDFCPDEYGYLNGEGGRGCPLPGEDADGDGIIDSDDVCGNTTMGDSVDTSGEWMGCSENQKDDDSDTVPNALDRCANTTANATVDENGCSDDQLTSDSDADGIPDIDDICPETTAGENVTADGCAAYQLDEDEDGVSNAEDDCPGTANGAVVDEVGCPRSDMDSDGDGYADDDDDFPLEPSQWGDYDRDGYGDNLSGVQGDSCPAVFGNSTGSPEGDRWGCADTDGDGWSDPGAGWGIENSADAFLDDPTQWADSDDDGFGDNASGNNGDVCPTAPGVLDGLNGVGCPAATDGDGNEVDECDKWESTFDPTTNPDASVPEDLESCEWYDRWYSASEESAIPWSLIGMSIGALLVVAILGLVMMRFIRGDEWDDDDDDFYEDDDDDFDDDIFAAPSQTRSGGGWKTPSSTQDFSGMGDGPSRGSSVSRGGPPARGGGRGEPAGPGGRGGGPPSRGTSRGGPAAGPPSRGGSPPSRSPVQSGPQGGQTGRSAGPPTKSTKRKVASDGGEVTSERKVRKVSGGNQPPAGVKTRSTKSPKAPQTPKGKSKKPAGPKSWDDLFGAKDSANYARSLGETKEALQKGEPERNLLRNLQTEGWSAKQSRYILNESDN